MVASVYFVYIWFIRFFFIPIDYLNMVLTIVVFFLTSSCLAHLTLCLPTYLSQDKRINETSVASTGNLSVLNFRIVYLRNMSKMSGT